MVYCPFDPDNTDYSHIPLNPKTVKAFENWNKSRTTTKGATFNVTYIGFTNEARNAFQYAVDIWSSLLSSDVEINVTVDFVVFENPNTLGGAGPGTYFRYFDGAPDSNFYAVALAEKMAGKELNDPDAADINASFSSEYNFYFGTDGNTPAGQQDFVTLVLHELGHGLGFADLNSINNSGTGFTGFNGSLDAYSSFLIDGQGIPIRDFDNPSLQLGDYLTSDNLFSGSELAFIANGDEYPKVYAPATWSSGSSIAHWDESTYPPRDPNTLMTPFSGNGQSAHDPGPNTLSLFADMGWVHTRIVNESAQIVKNLVDDITIQASIATDTALASTGITLHYSFDNFVTEEMVQLTEVGGIYSATITNPGEISIIKYYFDGVEDVLGRTYEAPSAGSLRRYYELLIVPDLPIGIIPYENTFDGLDNFISANVSGTTFEKGNSSIVGKNGTSSGGFAWVSGVNEANYLNNTETYLYSELFDFTTTGGYRLLMDANFSFEDGVDGFIVEYSTNEGISWNPLGNQVGKWYNSISRGSSPFLSGSPIFSGTTNGQFQEFTSSLTFLAGEPSVWFRLKMLTNGEGGDVGVAVDDFTINYSEASSTFSFDKSLVYLNEILNFTYTGTGAASYEWDFGDGTQSIEQNPSHAYTTEGTYEVTLTVTDANGTTDFTTNTIQVLSTLTSLLLEEGGDMEINQNYFVAENISGTPFQLGKSTIVGKDGTASGDFAWVTGLDAAQYVDDSEAYLNTPEFDFSNINGTYTLSFKSKFSFESDWDGFIVEYSTNRGLSWLKLNPVRETGWYNNTSNPESVFGASVPIFSGVTNGFQLFSTDVSHLAGSESVVFRFKFLTDAAVTDVGMAIDDFQLEAPVSGDAIPLFSATGITNCSGQVVTFTNESEGSITSFNWDFGNNASPATATGPGPHNVTYSGEGFSTVTLNVESPVNGSQSFTQVDLIETVALDASFTVEFDNVTGDYLLTASQAESYQWYKDGVAIPGEINQTLRVDLGDGGEYTVLVSAGACELLAQAVVVSGLESIPGFNFYPNPSKGEIWFNGLNERTQIQILSVDGRLIHAHTLSKGDDRLNLSNLSKGIYLIKVAIGDQVGMYKLIMEE